MQMQTHNAHAQKHLAGKLPCSQPWRPVEAIGDPQMGWPWVGVGQDDTTSTASRFERRGKDDASRVGVALAARRLDSGFATAKAH